MEEGAALQRAPHRPDRRLVRHDDRLVAGGHDASVVDGTLHPRDHLDIGLTPGRTEGVPEFAQEQGVAEQSLAPGNGQPLEGVLGLDGPLVDAHGEAVHFGDRRGGLLRTLQRAGDDMADVVISEVGRGQERHLATEGREMELGEPPVEDAVGVVHLAMPQQVHDRALLRGCGLTHGAIVANHAVCRVPTSGGGARREAGRVSRRLRPWQPRAGHRGPR